MKIRYINHGIGFRVGNTIYLNENLKKYPLLRLVIIDHEKNHTPGYSLKDFKHDLVGGNLKGFRRDMWKFMFKHPRAFSCFLPLNKIKGRWTFDPTLTFFWVVTLSMVGWFIW